MTNELDRFIDHARDKGLDYATIRQLLSSAGWKDAGIAQAFCKRELELPIPEANIASTKTATSRTSSVPRKARDAFFHLLGFGSLYVWATSVVVLLFVYLNFAFPDPAWRTSYRQVQELLSIMRLQLAIVIVAFPIFLSVWNYLLREVRRNPESGKGLLRRWLGNMALFVGAISLAGNTMTLVYFLLEGQLTIRFVLKSLAMFVVAGGLVGYLAVVLHSEAKGRAAEGHVIPRLHRSFSLLASIVVIVTFFWGIVLVGSPGTARMQRIDSQRLADLRTIFREVQSLCHDPDEKGELKRPLPETIEQLAAMARTSRINPVDPETGEHYLFRLKDDETYVLGATFFMSRDSDTDVFWNHPPGEHLFTINALDPP